MGSQELGRPMMILIVEDDAETLEAMDRFFTKKGFSVTTATGGLEGLKLLESGKTPFDCLVTDIVMPDISGVGIISVAKKKYPEMPVIAITGWGEHPEALAAEAEADVVYRKPFDLEQMAREILSFR